MKNTKTLSLVLVFVLAAAVMFASPLGLGVTAGGTLSFVDSNVPGDRSIRYGGTGGIFGTYSLYAVEDTMDLSVRPEIIFTMKGYRDNNDNKVNLNTIEVPLLVKISLQMRGQESAYTLIGPSIGMSIDRNVKNDDGDDITGIYPLDFKLLDVGVVFGAGIETENGLGIDVRFNLGVLNIIDSDYYYMKNRTISVMTSYDIL